MSSSIVCTIGTGPTRQRSHGSAFARTPVAGARRNTAWTSGVCPNSWAIPSAGRLPRRCRLGRPRTTGRNAARAPGNIRKQLRTQRSQSRTARERYSGHEQQRANAMSRIVKIAASLAIAGQPHRLHRDSAAGGLYRAGCRRGDGTPRPQLRPARPLLCPTVLPWLLRIPARAPPLVISAKRPANPFRRDAPGTAVHRSRVRRIRSAWADRRIW